MLIFLSGSEVPRTAFLRLLTEPMLFVSSALPTLLLGYPFDELTVSPALL